jgi:toxin ParE1/3/4
LSGGPRRWRVRQSRLAGRDLEEIVTWTLEQFGRRQAETYNRTLEAAVLALARGPGIPGVRGRPEIGPNLHTLHVARGGRRGRHFVLFSVEEDQDGPFITILRFLYDGMDLARHAPPSSNT